jgi:LysR family transcriptional regulator, cell division regulator
VTPAIIRDDGNMDPKLLPDILVFLEVAQVGSISQAARRLHTVQTNVSARIQKLESALGQKLLTRTNRGTVLTPAGETLVPTARRLGSLLGDIRQTFPGSTPRQARLLRIGSLETFAAAHVAKLIAGFKKIDPEIEYAIKSGSSRSLIQMLQEGKLDVAFVSHPGAGGSLRTELTIQEELVLLVPLNGRDSLSLNDLLSRGDLPLIVQRRACSYTERYLSYVAERHLPAPRLIDAGSIEALLELIEQGLGVAVAPRSLVNRRERRIKIISLEALKERRWLSVHLISNPSHRSTVLQKFAEHCRQQLRLGRLVLDP